MPNGDQPSPALPWLSRATLTAARAARPLPGALAHTGDGGSETVREIILAHHPALPLTMIADAVAYVLGAE